MLEPNSERMQGLIIGAGVAGLTLAARLRQRGEDATVIEREKALADSGYVLGLYPLGSRVLHGLGLYDQYMASSATLCHDCIHDGKGARLRDYSLHEVNQRFGPSQGISRGGLLDLLQQGVDGVPILGTVSGAGSSRRLCRRPSSQDKANGSS